MFMVSISSPCMVSACEDVADHWDHLCAVQLHGAQTSADRLCAGGVDEIEPSNAERLDGTSDPAGYRLWRADVQGAVLDLAFVLLRAYRRPATQRADAITHDPVVRPMQFPGLLVCVGDKAGRVHPDRISSRPELLCGAAVEVEVGGEAFGRTAGDGKHERKPVACRADDRLR